MSRTVLAAGGSCISQQLQLHTAVVQLRWKDLLLLPARNRFFVDTTDLQVIVLTSWEIRVVQQMSVQTRGLSVISTPCEMHADLPDLQRGHTAGIP